MKRPSALILGLWLLCTGWAGCAAPQACKEQERIRCCVLQLLTDQIMDNLVRAANGLPIIQLNYSEMSATVTVDVNGNIEGSQSVKAARELTNALKVAREFTNNFKYVVGGKDTSVVVIRAAPILDRDEVYNAYLEFLNEPGSLVVTAEPPPPGVAHVVKCFDKAYYWVPNEPEFKKLFLRLALITSAQRGQPLKGPADFFEATIEDVDKDAQKGLLPGQLHLTAKLSKKIPSGAGRLVATIDGKPYPFPVLRYKGAGKAFVEAGALTDRVVLVFHPDNPDYQDLLGKEPQPPPGQPAPGAIVGALQSLRGKDPQLAVDRIRRKLINAPAQIYLDDYRPRLRTTEDLLQGISNRLEDIRINQLR